MKLISFYTRDTIYEKEIEDLKMSCEVLGIDHYIEAREDLGSWEKNCGQKPLFILECLKKFQKPLLWVDADGLLLQKPTLELKNCDLGLYFNNIETKHARNGTIYVNPTKRCKHFLKLWHEKQLELETVPDQPVMIDLIRQIPLEITPLPLAYSHVFDKDIFPLEKTVILHSQASRTCRMDRILWQHLSGRELKAMRLQVSQIMD